jgi:hypothetical protein
MNWFNFNQNSYQIKKAMFDLIQERYQRNEQIIERLGVSLVTEGDLKSFLKMIADVYESGYMKSVNDHKEQLNKLGLNSRIVPQPSKDG